MEWYLVKKCLWIPYLMLLLRIHRCLGCLEEERVALLEINKVFLERSVAKDGSRVYTKGNDCCGWERVKCNATTGRVIQLSLDGFMELEMGNENENGSYLNVTLFSAFQELQHLNLSYRLFDGWIKNEGFEKLAGLRKLEVLDLSYNHFNNRIFASLATLKSIKILSLFENNLEGSSHFEELFTLIKLQSLDLSNNSLNASSRQFQDLCQLKHLQELDLSWNNFEGILPPCLQNLTTLKVLDLSHNRFKGNIHSSLISSLTSLVSISLSYNDFDGLFSFSSFANNCNLESIDLSSAGNKLKVETEYPSWVPPFQLKDLLLSNNNLNATIPRFLTTQHNLTFIDLSSNNLTGMFPTWLLENNKMLEVLILRNNSLGGHFVPSDIHRATNIMDISNNGFNGLLQENFGKTPEMKAQFSTFNSTSYEGNPFLCGPPLSRLCSSHTESINTLATTSTGVNVDDDIDMTAFFASFGASYVVFLLGFAAILYVNPYWRRMWFHFIEHCIHSCHEFLSNTWY